jgi:GntR family transcriptional regulator
MNLQKKSPIPLYYQLTEVLREKIRLGELKPGVQLPSEREFSETYQISRMTVRQALAYLIREGNLVARQGLGTFVAEPKLAYDALHLLSFTEEMMLEGTAPASQVLEQAIVVPPDAVASDLALDSSATTVKIVRLRLSQETPLLLETVYIPAALCPGLEQTNLATQSLYGLLENRYRLRLSHARQTFETTTANSYEAQLFTIPVGLGMILLEGVTSLDTGQPVEYFKAIYRGDRFKFAMESERSHWSSESPNAPRLSVVMR